LSYSEHAYVDPEIPEVPQSSTAGEELELSPPQTPPRPWGPWATIGWTVICVLVMFGAQIAALIIFILLRTVTSGSTKIDDLATNGNVIALATLLSTLTTIGLVAILIWLRRYPIRDYLALRWPPARSILI
jgi:hypothetical protein